MRDPFCVIGVEFVFPAVINMGGGERGLRPKQVDQIIV